MMTWYLVKQRDMMGNFVRDRSHVSLLSNAYRG
jgi:hypothetical protein